MNHIPVFGILTGCIISMLFLTAALLWRRGRAARKGKRGERIVSKKLKKLRKADYILIDDILLPTASARTSQIDHIVVSTRGIFVIETKNLAGRISGSEHGQYWQQHLSSQSRQIYNPLLQNASHIRALRRYLKDIDDSLFISVVVFPEAWRLDIKADDIVIPRGLLPDRHIRRTFHPSERRKRRWWNPGREVRLDENRVVLSLDELAGELRRRKRVIDREELPDIAERIRAAALTDSHDRRMHTRYAKATSRNISREIRSGRCPRCGGALTVKESPHGEFVGCENYPTCRFTCSLDQLH